jgi:hypothetical protein
MTAAVEVLEVRRVEGHGNLRAFAKVKLPRGAALMIVVPQVKPSARIRLEFGWRGPPLINAEQIAARIFELAAERSPRVADLEQTIRGDTAIRRITWEPAP